MRPIPVLFITLNRLEYTKQALHALLKTEHDIVIFIWDNGSNADVVDYINTMRERESRIAEVVISNDNVGINKAFNAFIKAYRHSKYIAKVDNDTIVEPDWLDELLIPMEMMGDQLAAVGAFMQRPPSIVDGAPWTFKRWVDTVMKKVHINIAEDSSIAAEQFSSDVKKEIAYRQEYLAYNSYTGGTGVLIRTKIFWDHGLLFEKYPCLLGDWTTFQRLIFNGTNIAWYSGTTVKLLNIKEDGISLNIDYPDYEEQLRVMRDEGNKWYMAVGGAPGVAKFIADNGGREKLIDDLQERSRANG